MNQKWMFILAGSIIAIGMIGWTRTAYHLITHPPQTVAQDAGSSTDQAGAGNGATPVGEAAAPAQERVLEQAREDLAARLSVEKGRIELVEMRRVTWPDGSLGCPRPGMAYTQMLQDGWLIRLKVGDRIYEYHSGLDSAPFLCEPPPGKK
jgi:hypothetical protein